jgi:hypothetical protein
VPVHNGLLSWSTAGAGGEDGNSLPRQWSRDLDATTGADRDQCGPLQSSGRFPCARPLTPVVGVGSLAVHAEELRPGGEVWHGDSPDVAARYAEVFAGPMAELADVTVAPPLPNPPWVRWDHADSGAWPTVGCPGNRDQIAVPAYVVDTAARAETIF